MSVVQDEAFAAFDGVVDEPWWQGVRLKDVRDAVLTPGGRARVTFFERVEDEGRPHPRLRVEMPPAEDPAPPVIELPAASAPETAAAASVALRSLYEAVRSRLEPTAAERAAAPAGSERWYANSLRVRRTAVAMDALQARVDGWIRAGALAGAEADGARYALRSLEDEAFSGVVLFDDSDTGTYHGYRHDAPFVHWLERVLAGLPPEGSRAMDSLDPAQQDAVRAQRDQAQAHLDWLMRHKYAADGICETDIERTLGGLLVDRETRAIVSESPKSRSLLVPSYELLTVAAAAHPHAGESVYRDGADGATFRLQDGSAVDVAPGELHVERVDAERLTFERAPGDPRLREGVRFDWDGDGWIRPGAIEWVSWAGHCDVKAILEQLGITLADGPTVVEHRTDTGETWQWSRELLLEALAATVELGSRYRTADGEDVVERGIHRFGGARNDSLPDRVQFKGLAEGKSFRWPLAGRQESFRVTALELDGGPADLDRVFSRWVLDGASFRPNPRYEETVEGDINILDVSGARMEAEARCHVIDAETGYPREETRTVVLDLRPGAGGRQELGTHLSNAARREVFRVYYDPETPAIVAELDRWVREGDRYVPRPVPERTVTVPLRDPLRVTLSRETRRDDPALFQALLGVALRQAQNINADTEMCSAVWNGTVTRIAVRRVSEDAPTRTERWRVDLEARFGDATLDYLLRRSETGEPEAYAPVASESGGQSPDFLWQDFPDVGSKGIEGGRWVVNETMLVRDIVQVDDDRTAPGGIYVHDEHIKSTYEILFAALGGYPHTIVHANKRWGFRDEAAWQQAVDAIGERRAALTFQEE